MKEITVKNIPERIYKELERKAIRNNHTIDEEILIQLNNLVPVKSDDIKVTSQDWQLISKTNRESMKFTATGNEITQFKNNGRP